jgi:hypothetical protein
VIVGGVATLQPCSYSPLPPCFLFALTAVGALIDRCAANIGDSAPTPRGSQPLRPSPPIALPPTSPARGGTAHPAPILEPSAGRAMSRCTAIRRDSFCSTPTMMPTAQPAKPLGVVTQPGGQACRNRGGSRPSATAFVPACSDSRDPNHRPTGGPPNRRKRSGPERRSPSPLSRRTHRHMTDVVRRGPPDNREHDRICFTREGCDMICRTRGRLRRLGERRRERRWRADADATVRWATTTLSVRQLTR